MGFGAKPQLKKHKKEKILTMNDIILLKQGEIVLKGQNRRSFEGRLIANVKNRLKEFGDFSVSAAQSTVYVEPKDGVCDVDGAARAMSRVFGVVAVARAAACDKDRDTIVRTAKAYLAESIEGAASFKVESKRADKTFPMTSIELSQYVGGELAEAFPGTPVDVRNPGLVVTIEVREMAAYVHSAAIPGAGGMPVGSNGRAVTLLSGGIDSPVASYMIAKRGISLTPVHFHSFPYTSEQAKEKVVELTRILSEYCGRLTLELVPFTRIQEELYRNCPEPLLTILMRRSMMRIARRIGETNGCGAIVTGENLGQVASQTMQAMAVTEECAVLPVFRPVIGMDKEEIVRYARKIGTFETSILPYEDCCTVFTPRHPKTKPRLGEVRDAESRVDIEALENEAFDGIERIKMGGY